jgi:hypothetical protein
MIHTPEWHEKRDIGLFLDSLGPSICTYVKHTTGGFGASGNGDFTVNLTGAYWNVEAKRPGKNPTAIQTRRMNEVRAAGGHAVAGTAEVVIQVLRDWLKGRGIQA